MSNLSNIGFGIQNRNDLNEIIHKAVGLGHITKAVPDEGICVVYTDKSGAELWLTLNEDSELTGFNPHFKGQSKRTVCLTAAIYPPKSPTNEVFYHAWADPAEENKPETGVYPFVFNAADFNTNAVINQLQLPQNVQIQLAALAQQLNYYATKQDFDSSQDAEILLDSRLFIPTGLFVGKDTETTSPQPLGMIIGVVKEWQKLQNDLTKQWFYWLLLDTYGGTVDVLADTTLLPNDPQIDSIIQAQCWLSGQIIGVPNV